MHKIEIVIGDSTEVLKDYPEAKKVMEVTEDILHKIFALMGKENVDSVHAVPIFSNALGIALCALGREKKLNLEEVIEVFKGITPNLEKNIRANWEAVQELPLEEEPALLDWYGYLHENGKIIIKRYFGKDDIKTALESDFVMGTYGPVKAANYDEALDKIKSIS